MMNKNFASDWVLVYFMNKSNIRKKNEALQLEGYFLLFSCE